MPLCPAPTTTPSYSNILAMDFFYLYGLNDWNYLRLDQHFVAIVRNVQAVQIVSEITIVSSPLSSPASSCSPSRRSRRPPDALPLPPDRVRESACGNPRSARWAAVRPSV